MSQDFQYDVDGRIEMPQPLVAQQESYYSPMDLQEFPSPTHPSGLLSPPAQVYTFPDGDVQASYVGDGMMLGRHVLSDHQRSTKSDGMELSEISSNMTRGDQITFADATVRMGTGSGCCCSCVIM